MGLILQGTWLDCYTGSSAYIYTYMSGTRSLDDLLSSNVTGSVSMTMSHCFVMMSYVALEHSALELIDKIISLEATSVIMTQKCYQYDRKENHAKTKCYITI